LRPEPFPLYRTQAAWTTIAEFEAKRLSKALP
jgi:hypothetical protein